MSLITSNALLNQTNFSVRTPVPPYTPNRASPLQSGVAVQDDMGHVTSTIPASSLLGHTIVVSPTGAPNTTIAYTLPTAAALLYEFGRSIDNGVPKTSKGNMLVFNVVNRGSCPASVVSNSVGGDGTAVLCGTGAVGSGTRNVTGKITPIYLEWLEVSGGVNGSTGLYTVYSS